MDDEVEFVGGGSVSRADLDRLCKLGMDRFNGDDYVLAKRVRAAIPAPPWSPDPDHVEALHSSSANAGSVWASNVLRRLHDDHGLVLGPCGCGRHGSGTDED